MMLHVHRGKGAKDRFVPLPKTTLGDPAHALENPPQCPSAVPGLRPR